MELMWIMIAIVVWPVAAFLAWAVVHGANNNKEINR